MNICTDEVVTLAGMRGTGKSTFFNVFLRGLTPSRVLLWDTLDQHETLKVRRTVPQKHNLDEFEGFMQDGWDEGNVVIAVEEAEEHLKNTANYLPPVSSKVIKQGRNRNIGVLVNTREPQDISKRVFNLSDHLIIFRLDYGDIPYMIDRVFRKRPEAVEYFEDMAKWPEDCHDFIHDSKGVFQKMPALRI